MKRKTQTQKEQTKGNEINTRELHKKIRALHKKGKKGYENQIFETAVRGSCSGGRGAVCVRVIFMIERQIVVTEAERREMV